MVFEKILGISRTSSPTHPVFSKEYFHDFSTNNFSKFFVNQWDSYPKKSILGKEKGLSFFLQKKKTKQKIMIKKVFFEDICLVSQTDSLKKICFVFSIFQGLLRQNALTFFNISLKFQKAKIVRRSF